MPLEIRRAGPSDWAAIRRIYAEGIATGNATFETDVADAAALDERWLPNHRWVAVQGDVVVGWAAVSPVSSRSCYRGVGETSVYVTETARGAGTGSMLVRHQIRQAELGGLWTLQTSIFPENEVSLAIHRRAGFREVGRRERIAQLDGVWRDTILLEWRSRL